MENHLLDLGACIRDARERLGYTKVVLAGWSGGGSPMMGYQARRRNRPSPRPLRGSRRCSPIRRCRPPTGDAAGAPRSRHRLLTEFLDASITDEISPEHNRDAEFDLYDPANPNQPPYTADFLAAYRQRQRDRSHRITAFAQEKLAAFALPVSRMRARLRGTRHHGRSALA